MFREKEGVAVTIVQWRLVSERQTAPRGHRQRSKVSPPAAAHPAMSRRDGCCPPTGEAVLLFIRILCGFPRTMTIEEPRARTFASIHCATLTAHSVHQWPIVSSRPVVSSNIMLLAIWLWSCGVKRDDRVNGFIPYHQLGTENISEAVVNAAEEGPNRIPLWIRGKRGQTVIHRDKY